MFFIITPALICGAFAERMKFSTMVVFMVLWGTLIYCPLAHWIWGGGILAYGSPHAQIARRRGPGFRRRNGGAHQFRRVGLDLALMLGKRLGYGQEPMPPHNLTYTTIGAAMLWVGWFGFNAGSALAASRLAASAFAATHFAAAAGGLTWAGVGVDAAGKAEHPGHLLGPGGRLGLRHPGRRLRYADARPGHWGRRRRGMLYCLYVRQGRDSATTIRWTCSAFTAWRARLGAILTGVFATRATGACGDGKLLGLLEGGPLLKAQLAAVGAGWALAVVGTFVILKVWMP